MKKITASCPAIYSRLYKLSNTLQQIKNGRKKVSFNKLHLLVKQFNRTLRKLVGGWQPAAKACSVFALSVLLSKDATAQCDSFYNADAVNPITAHGLPASRKPYFVDIDGDGDLDCYVLDQIYYYDAPFLFKNVGTAQLPAYKYEPSESGFPLGQYALSFASTNMQFADIDGDGDYDCFLAEAYSGNFDVHIKYFENTGTSTHPVFTENETENPLKGYSGFYFIDFTLADIDGDSDLDAYINDGYFTELLRNEGTKTNAQFVYVNGSSTTDAGAGERVYYDWNKDGLLDYFNQDFFYGFHYYKNIGPKNNPKYIIDDANGPKFLNGYPHAFTDLNKDGAPEVFNSDRGFSTLTPVPLVDTSLVYYKGKSLVRFAVTPTSSSYTYQAYRNGVAISGATYPFYVAFTGGFYSFTITDSCGTGFSLPFRVKYGSDFTESEIAKTSVFSLTNKAVKAIAYPNPFTSSITLQLTAGAASGVAQITDLQGRLLIKQKISGSQISIGNGLSAGVYLLQIISNNTVVYSQKIVKE